MIVNGRSIRAKVMEQEAAREIARQKKAEGLRTTLVEMERGNLFTLSLGNVQSNDIIIIRFAYVEELDAWKDELAPQIPFNPGVRYVPGEPLLRANSGRDAVDDTDQVPDASRLSPPRIDQMHPDAARISLSGTLEGCDVDLCSTSSPTHPTAVRPTGSSFEIFLLIVRGAWPARNGPKPPMRSLLSSKQQRSMTVSGSRFSEPTTTTLPKSPWSATPCCGNRISNPLPNSARVVAPNYFPRCVMSLEFINNFQPGAAAISFSSRTAR
jgi:hypothetical protein